MKTKKVSVPLFLISLFCLASGLLSCEQLLVRPKAEHSPHAVFESLWTQVNHRYSYFDLKGVNWDSVRSAYEPRIRDDMSDRELFRLLAEMMFLLRDGHVNLESPFDLARNWNWYLDRPENFNFSILERNYLGQDYAISGPFLHRWMGEVGYVYYGSFAASFQENELDAVMEQYSQAKGMIWDIRGNGGGSLDNARRIARRMADEKRPVLKWYYKTGPEPEAFGKGVTEFLEPGGKARFSGPVILLTNRSSYSAATFFTAMMKGFPQVQSLGDTTGGGGGLPWLGELPNGWTYRFSSTRSQMPDGTELEPGIAPDIIREMTQQDVAAGRDVLLEAALEVLK